MHIPFYTLFFDMRNAFGATKQEVMFKACEDMYEKPDLTFIEQRIMNTTTTIEAMDRRVTLIHEEGGPMGTSEGPRLFARPFCKMLGYWNEKVWQNQTDGLRLCHFRHKA